MEAQDFRVEIGAGGAQGYEVILRAPDGGEAVVTMRLPRDAGELEALAARVPDAVIASSAVVRRDLYSDERPVRQLGELLFDAVLAGDGRGMFAAAATRPLVRVGSCGPGGELRIVGKAVIGGALTGVTGPDEIGKAETGGPVTRLADADDSGDPPGAALVPQAARPTVAKLAMISVVKTCARVVRRMLVRRPAGTHGSVLGRQDRAGGSSRRICRGVDRVSRASRAGCTKMTQPVREKNAIPGRPSDQARAHQTG